MKHFEVLDVTRALGVAPSTGSIIAALLSGKVDPDNCRNVGYWPMADFEVPPQGLKVLTAIASLLDEECEIRQMTSPDRPYWYVTWMPGQPTVVWFTETHHFEFMVVK